MRKVHYTSGRFIFFASALLMVIANSMVFLLANSNLGFTEQFVSTFIRFSVVYTLLVYLIGMAIYNQYVRRLFRPSWFVPVVYCILCIYAALQGEGRSMNWILGYIRNDILKITKLTTNFTVYRT